MNDDAADFAKEKKEHPEFTDEQIRQIVRDHAKKDNAEHRCPDCNKVLKEVKIDGGTAYECDHCEVLWAKDSPAFENASPSADEVSRLFDDVKKKNPGMSDQEVWKNVYELMKPMLGNVGLFETSVDRQALGNARYGSAK